MVIGHQNSGVSGANLKTEASKSEHIGSMSLVTGKYSTPEAVTPKPTSVRGRLDCKSNLVRGAIRLNKFGDK
jgi:hypothetical protein